MAAIAALPGAAPQPAPAGSVWNTRRDSAAALLATLEAAGAGSAAVSTDPVEAAQLIEVRRLAYPATERLGRCLVEDVGVPRSRLAEMIERRPSGPRRRGAAVGRPGHLGDRRLRRPGGVNRFSGAAAA